jgi:NADH-ubiquinone oxidoreductase chain 6
MSYLYIFNETFTNGFNYNLLDIISLLSVICGISVIISNNPVVSVLFLIGLFFSIAGYLMMLGLNFIGLSYLLVYVGAVSILFLFILMLINVRISELLTDNNNSIPLAITICLVSNLGLFKLLPYNLSPKFSIDYINLNSATLYGNNNTIYSQLTNLFYNNKDNLSYVTSQVWDGALAETSHITSIGNVLYTVYPMWLILTSLILLLAMVGAIVITIKQ